MIIKTGRVVGKPWWRHLRFGSARGCCACSRGALDRRQHDGNALFMQANRFRGGFGLPFHNQAAFRQVAYCGCTSAILRSNTENWHALSVFLLNWPPAILCFHADVLTTNHIRLRACTCVYVFVRVRVCVYANATMPCYYLGHGNALGGCIVDSGKFEWGQHPEKFPST